MVSAQTVVGPDGAFVIRPERSGVGTSVFQLGGGVDLFRRIRRFARGDRSWILEIRSATSDPFGPAFHSVRVDSKSEIAAATEQLAAAIRTGEITDRR